jgi:hypothetical protein
MRDGGIMSSLEGAWRVGVLAGRNSSGESREGTRNMESSSSKWGIDSIAFPQWFFFSLLLPNKIPNSFCDLAEMGPRFLAWYRIRKGNEMKNLIMDIPPKGSIL